MYVLADIFLAFTIDIIEFACFKHKSYIVRILQLISFNTSGDLI